MAWKHADSYPLQVLAGIMNGKTGRLYKKLVEEKGIAKSSGGGGRRMYGGGGLEVSANQDSLKYAGAFRIRRRAFPACAPSSWKRRCTRFSKTCKQNPVSDEELQKVKNQLRVETIRFLDMMSGIGMLFYLGGNAAMGDWTEANNNPDKCDLVTAEDVQRVANKYFEKNQRNVLIINSEERRRRKARTAGGEDPRFAQAVQMIKSSTDAGQLEQMVGMFSMRMDQVEDPEQTGSAWSDC